LADIDWVKGNEITNINTCGRANPGKNGKKIIERIERSTQEEEEQEKSRKLQENTKCEKTAGLVQRNRHIEYKKQSMGVAQNWEEKPHLTN
jgi:hypothetical protein